MVVEMASSNRYYRLCKNFCVINQSQIGRGRNFNKIIDAVNIFWRQNRNPFLKKLDAKNDDEIHSPSSLCGDTD